MSDFLLIQNALRDALRPRRLLIALLLTLVPPALALGYRILTPPASYVPNDVYDSLVVSLVFSFTLAILSVVNGTGVVSQEVEGRTIIYLLTRPFPRWRILLSKFIVAWFLTSVVTLLSTLLIALAAYGAEWQNAGIWADIRALLIGSLAYGSLFLLMGTALPRPLTYGLLLVFGWETWVPKLPGQFARISIMTYLRIVSQRQISGEGTPAGGENFLLSFARPPELHIPQWQAWLILWLISAVCLGAALWVFSTREYAPREDAE